MSGTAKASAAATELAKAIADAVKNSPLRKPDEETTAEVIDSHLEPLLRKVIAANDALYSARFTLSLEDFKKCEELFAEAEKWEPGR
jgi:hypothetical protein